MSLHSLASLLPIADAIKEEHKEVFYFHGLDVKSSRGSFASSAGYYASRGTLPTVTYVGLHTCDSSLFGADYALPQLAVYYFYFINVFTHSYAVFGF